LKGTKETNQRKCLPRQGETVDSLLRVISRLGILPRLETAHIHVRRPTGLDTTSSFHCREDAGSKPSDYLLNSFHRNL
jgi:hypothetical protein